jgi:hypothetical protein
MCAYCCCFGLLLTADRRHRIADAIHQRFRNEIRLLLGNLMMDAPDPDRGALHCPVLD